MGPAVAAVLLEVGFGLLDRFLDGLGDVPPDERDALLARYQVEIAVQTAKAAAWRPLTPADQAPAPPGP